MTDTEKLIELQNRIEEAKINKATIEGKLQGLKEQLKELLATDNIEEAKKKIEKLTEEIESEEKELKEKLEILEKECDWI